MIDPIGSGPACWETIIFPATDHYRKAVVPVKADRENRLENLEITHPCPSATGHKLSVEALQTGINGCRF